MLELQHIYLYYPGLNFLYLLLLGMPMLLIMEFMENGSMDKYLKHHKQALQDDAKQLVTWTLEVAQVSPIRSLRSVH